ncbi:MAG: metallophosphoesterase [Phycisphaerae bacterium]
MDQLQLLSTSPQHDHPVGGSRKRKARKVPLVGRFLWSVANSVALGGLYPGPLGSDWLLRSEVDMPMHGLSAAWTGSTIAHISDLHCSPIVGTDYLLNCVEAVNQLRPDFVCITGDLITGHNGYARKIARVLRALRPRVATLAVLGNHDYGVMHPCGAGEIRGQADYLTDQMQRAGVHVLRNEAKVFTAEDGSSIQFVGTDDCWSSCWDPVRAFARATPHLPTVTLCHNPDGGKQLYELGAEWVLAGHTHGKVTADSAMADRLWPMTHKHLVCGEYHLGAHCHMYVNRGLAFARRSKRRDRPEISLLSLRPTGSAVTRNSPRDREKQSTGNRLLPI